LNEKEHITQSDPNIAVIRILEEALIKTLKESKNDEIKVDRSESEENIDMDAWDEDDYQVEEVPLNKYSVSGDTLLLRNDIHFALSENIKIFRNLKIVTQAIEIKYLIDTHMKNFPDVFQIQIFEPLLSFKFTIDLNFLSVEPHIFESLGFDTEKSVEFLFVVNEGNIDYQIGNSEIQEMSFEDLIHQGILKIEYYQQEDTQLKKRYHSYLINLAKRYLENGQEAFFKNNSISVDNYEEHLEEMLTLEEMGFGKKIAIKALEINRFNIEDTINWLLCGEGK
jgi:hypothetical protein